MQSVAVMINFKLKMQSSTLLLIATLSLLILPSHLATAQSTIQVVPFRMQNLIQLECREIFDNGQFQQIESAQYWLNTIERGQELRQLDGVVVTEFPQGRISFRMTQELEGTYFCGRTLDQATIEGIPLIAFPDPTIIPSSERTFYSKAGTSARLNCSILPGALRQQYYADWRNATSRSDLARIVGPRTLPTRPVEDPRYTVDSQTFSLTINPVQLTDAGTYLCVVGVRDPAGLTMEYRNTEMIELNLIVYQSPLITEDPQDQVIALNGNPQSATFRCQARGEPTPEIQWMHRSSRAEQSEEYQIQQFAPVLTADGDFLVTSELTINDIDTFDNGEVTCVIGADLDYDDGFEVDLESSSSTALLAVIGYFDTVDLLISTNGDIIFKLFLPSTIQVPVQLFICYMDENDPEREPFTRLTPNVYQNTALITHFEPSSLVPSETFSNVRVKVALRYQRLQGPFNTTESHNLNVPTVFTQENLEAGVQKFIIVASAACVIGVAALLAIVILVLACIWQRYKRRKSDSKHTTDLEERQTEKETALETLRENLQNQIQEITQQNTLTLNQLREENRAELATREANHQRELQQLREQNDKLLNEQEERNLQVIRLKVIDEIVNNPADKRAMTIKIGGMVIIRGSTEECPQEECDGPMHTNYTAHSKRPPMLTRGETFDLDEATSMDSGIHEECVVDCMKSIVKASIKHPTIGPALKRFVSTEIGIDT